MRRKERRKARLRRSFVGKRRHVQYTRISRLWFGVGSESSSRIHSKYIGTPRCLKVNYKIFT